MTYCGMHRGRVLHDVHGVFHAEVTTDRCETSPCLEGRAYNAYDYRCKSFS